MSEAENGELKAQDACNLDRSSWSDRSPETIVMHYIITCKHEQSHSNSSAPKADKLLVAMPLNQPPLDPPWPLILYPWKLDQSNLHARCSSEFYLRCNVLPAMPAKLEPVRRHATSIFLSSFLSGTFSFLGSDSKWDKQCGSAEFRESNLLVLKMTAIKLLDQDLI